MIDFTPELRKQALAVLEKYNYGPLFTPPSLEKPTIQMPGIAGGASWAGAACDPETGILYVPSITHPIRGHAVEVADPGRSAMLERLRRWRRCRACPLWKPPYGRITAIDLNTGDHRWMVPMGDLAQRQSRVTSSLASLRSGEPRAVTCS